MGDARVRLLVSGLAEESGQLSMDTSAPAYYGLLPLIPLVLIFTFSKLVNTIRVDIYNAIVIYLIVVLLVEMIHRRFQGGDEQV